MKKLTKVLICAAAAVSYSFSARADIDILSFVQDQLETYSMGQQLTLMGERVNLQELKEAVSDRGVLEGLKEQGKNFAQKIAVAQAQNLVRQKVWPGVSDKISVLPTPQLASKLGVSMTRKKRVANEVEASNAQKEQVNKLLVENIAGMYAKGLVLRYSIQSENEKIAEEEKTELTDIPSVSDAYKAVSARAVARWRTLLDASASHLGADADYGLAVIRLSPEQAQNDEDASESAADSGTDASTAETLLSGDTKVDLGILGSMSQDEINEKLKSALTGVINGENPLQIVKDSAGNMKYYLNGQEISGSQLTQVMSAVESGDISSIINSSGGLSGSIVGGDLGQNISSWGSSAGSGINSAINGDIGGAINSAGNIAGSATGGDLGKSISSGISSGVNGANAAANGNTSGFISALGQTIGSGVDISGGDGSKATNVAGGILNGISTGNTVGNNVNSGTTDGYIDGFINLFDGVDKLQEDYMKTVTGGTGENNGQDGSSTSATGSAGEEKK